MELVEAYLDGLYIGNIETLPFPEYLNPKNRLKNPFWLTQEGEMIYPEQMRDSHLIRTLNLIHRLNSSLEDMYDLAKSSECIVYGKYALHMNKDFYMKSNPQYIMAYRTLWNKAPLYMLLRRELVKRNMEGALYE